VLTGMDEGSQADENGPDVDGRNYDRGSIYGGPAPDVFVDIIVVSLGDIV